jgi:hypothetical protein
VRHAARLQVEIQAHALCHDTITAQRKKRGKKMTLPRIFCTGGGLQFECYPLPSLKTRLLMAECQHFPRLPAVTLYMPWAPFLILFADCVSLRMSKYYRSPYFILHMELQAHALCHN